MDEYEKLSIKLHNVYGNIASKQVSNLYTTPKSNNGGASNS